MSIVLFTKNSPFQIYCANQLFKHNLLTDVIIEKGSSFAANNLKTWENRIRKLTDVFNEPSKMLQRVVNTIKFPLYYGRKDFHDQRILKTSYLSFNKDLKIHNVEKINDENTKQLLELLSVDLAFVFGTSIISNSIINILNSPILNMHWGWSPDYRGEGIVSALANGGVDDLGVTVHIIDSTIDGGSIIQQSRPKVDIKDNFYSIGLKLTILGTDIFKKVVADYRITGNIKCKKQILKKGQFRGSKHMYNHPELVPEAYKNLKKHCK